MQVYNVIDESCQVLNCKYFVCLPSCLTTTIDLLPKLLASNLSQNKVYHSHPYNFSCFHDYLFLSLVSFLFFVHST